MTVPPIDRAFVRLEEGLVHLRRVDGSDGATPLLLLHASPGSSRGLEPLLRALAEAGGGPALIAPDTLGHGDSVPSTEPEPEIATYAHATIRLLDALGLDRVALYGAHTGARIAVEAAVLHPDRIDRVILDGIGEYGGEMQADLLAHYAPAKRPDDYGTQLMWAFHFVRDQALHFPHYTRDPAHRLMSRAVPDADALHESTLEVLKGLRTYHHAYRAAFQYPTRARLALLRRPLTLLDMESELPTLRTQMQALIAVAEDAAIEPAGRTMADKAAAIRRVLDR